MGAALRLAEAAEAGLRVRLAGGGLVLSGPPANDPVVQLDAASLALPFLATLTDAWRLYLLAWPGADRSGWWFRYQHHQAAGLSAPRAQRRAFLELCETRLVLGLDVDAPAPEPAERLALPPSCMAEYFEEAPCRRNHGPFRECPGLVNRERDQIGGTRLPPELRPPPWLDVPVEASGT